MGDDDGIRSSCSVPLERSFHSSYILGYFSPLFLVLDNLSVMRHTHRGRFMYEASELMSLDPCLAPAPVCAGSCWKSYRVEKGTAVYD